MHIELAKMDIQGDDDVALTRNKAYQLGMALGVSSMRSSRMATRVSEHCRGLSGGSMSIQLQQQGDGGRICWHQADWTLTETIAQWPNEATVVQQKQHLSQLSKPAMMRDLHARYDELESYKEGLEKKVEERTKELQLRAQQLEESTRLKSEFLANMSHELRTPMNSIIGFTGRVLKKAGDELSPRHSKNLRTVERNAHHLLGLINSLLDLSKIEAGKMEIFAEEFMVDELFREVMELTDSLVTNKGISIHADVPDDAIAIFSDKTKLKQILINLISNAVKFTDEGGVTLRVRPVSQGIEIKVIDTGMGMEADALKYIFEAFRQVDGTNTRSHGGTGLGLNITSQFCDMLGGEVGVESEVGVGSTFIVTLPLRYQPKEVQGAVEIEVPDMRLTNDKEYMVDTPQQVEVAHGSPVVVCIDDNAEVLELLSEYLDEAGYQAVCVNNGKEGVIKARELQPIAITLDVQMPHKDGWSVLKELKDDPATRDIPVLMATMMQNKALGFELGAYDYLEKPIMPENLIRSIEAVPTRVRHVLVVDDDEGVRELMQQTLEDKGIISTLAVDGIDALEKLKGMGAALPDMIVLDLMMPRMDGFEVLDSLSEHEIWKNIPVVVSTAKTLSHDEKALLAAKASNIVQKGGDSLDKLVSSIHRGGGNQRPRKAAKMNTKVNASYRRPIG